MMKEPLNGIRKYYFIIIKRFDDSINYFFMADILINFFSAYYDEDNVLVTNNIYIAKNYLKGWFLIDVLSV